MAYDRDLADRIRAALAGESVVREVRMFGGLSFMVNDKLAVGANTHGNLLVRVDPGRVEDLVAVTAAERAEMNGRPMSKGWLVVDSGDVTSDQDLNFWVSAALDYSNRGDR